MPTTYKSTKAVAGQVGKANIGLAGTAFSFDVETALALDDIIQLFKIPAGAVLLWLHLEIPDLDTNVSPAIVLDVGDAADDDRYVLGSTVGQAAGKITTEDFVAGAIGFVYTADDVVSIHVDTAPATGATGVTIKGVAIWTSNP